MRTVFREVILATNHFVALCRFVAKHKRTLKPMSNSVTNDSYLRKTMFHHQNQPKMVS